MKVVCSRMIKLYTAVIPDYGGVFFYIARFCFSSKTHRLSTWSHFQKKRKRTKRKTKEKHLCLQKEGQHIACIILEVVKILKISG